MVTIVWTDFAKEDIKSIYQYIAKDSEHYAERFIEKLIQKVDLLEHFPQSGRVVPEFANESIRELIEGNYRIIYHIQEHQIGIVRIHHAAMILKGL